MPTPSDDLVTTYLLDLNIALRIVGSRVRREYLYEITQHIGEARLELAPDDEQGVRELLDNLGEPDALAAELLAAQRSQSGNWWQRRVASTGLVRVIALTTIGLLLVLAAIGLVYSNLYRPLYLSLGGVGGAQVLAPNGTPAQTVPDSAQTDNGAPTVYLEPTSKWFTVKIIATLYNDGPFPIVIDSVGSPSPFAQYDIHVLFDGTAVAQGSYGWRGGPRFHRFTLHSHENQTVLITYKQQCEPLKGSVTSYSSVPVTYSYMFFHHSANVDVEPFDVQMSSTCS